MNSPHIYEHTKMQGSRNTYTGFILPALVVISLVLVSMGVVALQYVTTASNSIQSSNFDSIARSAADAGVKKALSCLEEQVEGWGASTLTPSTNCSGGEVPNAASTLSRDKRGIWSSTFEVGPTTEANGELVVTAKGRVDFFYAGATTPSKTFDATSKASVPIDAEGSERDVAQGLAVTKVSAGTGITCAIANMNLYCSGMRRDGRFATGTDANDYYATPQRINYGGFTNNTIFTDIQVNSFNHCAVADGQAYCWGRNALTPTGNGGTQPIVGPTIANNVSPTATTGFDSSQTRIASPGKSWDGGYQYSCFLNQLRVFCSGGNNVGQLGRPFVTRNCFIGCGAWYIRDDPHHSIGGLFPVNAGVPVPQRVYGYDAAAEVNEYTRSELLSQSNLSGTRPTDLQAGAYQACALFNARIACWGDRFVGVGVDVSGFPADIGNVKASSGLRGSNSLPVSSMGIGESTSCFVSNGKLYCWGFRPGNNTRKATVGGAENASLPHERWLTTATTGADLQDINVEGFHSQTDNHMCAYGDGDAYCWGPGVASTNRNLPSRIIAGLNVSNRPGVTGVSAGHNQICVVANGSQYCRGVQNTGVHYGVLGTDAALTTHTSSNTTVKSATIGLTNSATADAATKISSGANHSCAIANNYVYCWGDNAHGQLGDDTQIDKNQPTGINTKKINNFKSRAATHVAAGASHSCAIVSGDVYCWGNNSNGQLGNGTLTNSRTPVKVTLPGKATSVDAGENHTCAVANMRAYCWGSNTRGQLGIPTSTTRSLSPVGVTNLSSASSAHKPAHITTGSNFSCAIANAHAFCWGDNTHGQAGAPASATPITTPHKVATGAAGSTEINPLRDEWVALDAGGNFVCGSINQVVRCWGNNASGQLGRSSGSTHIPGTVTSNLSGQNVGWKKTMQLSAGANHACAIAAGESYCWGSNAHGKFGTGSASPASNFNTTRVTRSGGNLDTNNIYAISAGGNHTCGVANAKIFCWGLNSDGQLGDTTNTTRLVPTLQGKYIREGRSVDVSSATIY